MRTLLLAASITGSMLISTAAIAGCANAPAPIPDVSIAVPSDPDLAPYAGVWQGEWGGKACVVLVVKNINNRNDVEVIYTKGIYPKWGWNELTEWETHGSIDDEGLHLYWRDGSGAILGQHLYAYDAATGTIKALYWDDKYVSRGDADGRATLRRVE